MKTALAKICGATLLLAGLPLVGVYLAGYPVGRYLEFPPDTGFVEHAPFNGWVFSAYALFVAVIVGPFVWRAAVCRLPQPTPAAAGRRFPWWGWAGVGSGAAAWLLAWTRFEWFAAFQPHTFVPLWLSYILVVNALVQRRSGDCMMLRRTGYFLVLFPFSALFWWFFEFLNRFVQNWHYTGVHFDPTGYFGYATLSFSTVLPAVLGTRDLVIGAARVQHCFRRFLPLRWPHTRAAAVVILTAAVAVLAGIGVWPDLLFAFLWLAPLGVLVAVAVLRGQQHLFSGPVSGDWRRIVAAAVAALICGGFWEMWNDQSLAKWIYNVPFVHRFKLFEMPVLGYAGYLPFGLTCAALGELLERLHPAFTAAGAHRRHRVVDGGFTTDANRGGST
jgi:hypothetical protein